jgi:hypothetical protein
LADFSVGKGLEIWLESETRSNANANRSTRTNTKPIAETTIPPATMREKVFFENREDFIHFGQWQFVDLLISMSINI